MRHHTQEPRDDEVEAPIAGLRELRVDLEPGRDLWSGIEARIAPRPRSAVSANAWMSLAAAACVAVVVGMGVLRPLPPAEAPSTTAAFAAMPAANLQAVPGSRALVKANLQLSRSSETQIRKALQQDPESASLRRLLLTTEARSDELRRLLTAQAT
ncbi:hypothetical protein [Solimonas soli]|uniref:hypothetical protein n=1 Tax=Solimonas soli TaxID=413479 RepID=UPI000488253E|nr:hypothetical protein [Solimonas soli]